MKIDNLQIRAKEILSRFMTETAESHKIMRAFQHFYQTSIKIQRFFRDQRMMDKHRLDLVRRCWEINKDRM